VRLDIAAICVIFFSFARHFPVLGHDRPENLNFIDTFCFGQTAAELRGADSNAFLLILKNEEGFCK
jgi:hypothetical protein